MYSVARFISMRVRVANGWSAFKSQLRALSASTRSATFYLKPSAGSVQIKPLIGSAKRTISLHESPSPQKENQPSSFSVYYLLLPCQAIGLYRQRFRMYGRIYREDARTRSEPVPAWCRCNDDGTHFFLCIGYFRFHDTSDRFDTKRARNVPSR